MFCRVASWRCLGVVVVFVVILVVVVVAVRRCVSSSVRVIGETRGFFFFKKINELPRKHLPMMFSLIKNEGKGIEDMTVLSSSQPQSLSTREWASSVFMTL